MTIAGLATTQAKAGRGVFALEFKKLLGFRSVKFGLLVALIMPVILALGDFFSEGGLKNVIGADVTITSGWNVPTMALYIMMPFMLPLLTAITCAELVGGEMEWGTFRPLMIRPVSRSNVILSKLAIALLYPFVLLVVTLLGGLIIGWLLYGFAGPDGLVNGSGLGPEGFQSEGVSPLIALGELLRGYLIASWTLAPIAVLSLLFGVIFLNTASAGLAAIGSIILMGTLKAFPFITPLLLTEHLNAFAPQTGGSVTNSLILVTLYTVAGFIGTLFAFERKDL